MITFSILIITTIFFMLGKFRSDFVAICSLLALVLTGVISIGEALAGFSNSVVVMIAGLFIVGGGIFRTGLARMAGNVVLKFAGNSELKLLISLMTIVAFLSAFMSNTGTVAVLMPVIITVALGMKKSPAKFLMPMAFASSLGGVLTLIGTPPNLVVSQSLVDNGYEKLSFFDFTPIGLIALMTGMLFLTTIGKRLLPEGNKKEIKNHENMTPTQLVRCYEIANQLHRVKVIGKSLLINKSLCDLQLTKKYRILIMKIDRHNSEILPLISNSLVATSSTVIKEGDVLYIEGSKADIQRFIVENELIEDSIDQVKPAELISKHFGVAEVLLTPHSSFIDKTIETLRFRGKYNLHILGINRKGKKNINEWAKEPLQFGDALLVQGNWSDIESLEEEINDVVVIGQTSERANTAAANGKAPLAGLIMLGMLLMMTLEIVPAVTAVLISAVLMVLSGCLRNMDDAYGRINWESVFLIGAMLPMATALEKTGGITYLSDGLIGILGDYGFLAVMAGFYFLTMLFSQFISNTATAVLFAPIAITTALSLGASPYPFLIAVAVSASMAFATPVASPPNALIMTAGGYKFSDFVKVGVPLQLVIWIVMMFAIPFFFPF